MVNSLCSTAIDRSTRQSSKIKNKKLHVNAFKSEKLKRTAKHRVRYLAEALTVGCKQLNDDKWGLQWRKFCKFGDDWARKFPIQQIISANFWSSEFHIGKRSTSSHYRAQKHGCFWGKSWVPDRLLVGHQGGGYLRIPCQRLAQICQVPPKYLLPEQVRFENPTHFLQTTELKISHCKEIREVQARGGRARQNLAIWAAWRKQENVTALKPKNRHFRSKLITTLFSRNVPTDCIINSDPWVK